MFKQLEKNEKETGGKQGTNSIISYKKIIKNGKEKEKEPWSFPLHRLHLLFLFLKHSRTHTDYHLLTCVYFDSHFHVCLPLNAW